MSVIAGNETSQIRRARRRPGIPGAVGLILVGAVAAISVMLSAGFSRSPASGSTVWPGRTCTLTGSTTTPGGVLTVCARYSVSRGGLVLLSSVIASYRSQRGYSGPYFTVSLAGTPSGVLDQRLTGAVDQRDAALSYRSEFTAFRGEFRAPETMVVTLMATTYTSSAPEEAPLASVALVLGRQAFPCPDPGTADNAIPAC